MAMELGFKELSTNAKLVAIGVILLFFISLVSAETFQFDNVKSYDAVKQEVTITNTFGLGKDIAKIKLNTPLKNSVSYSNNSLIAEFTISSFNDEYINPFEKIDSYNAKDLSVKYPIQYEYKLKGTKEILIKAYNSTPEHYETIITWNDFDYSKLTNGTYTIGIFTDTTKVKRNQEIEFIPTFFSKELTEFAVWVVEGHGYTLGTIGNYANAFVGTTISPKEDIYIRAITKQANCSATRGYVQFFNGTIMAMGEMSGNWANLSNPVLLKKDVVYAISFFDTDGQINTPYLPNSPKFPVEETYFWWANSSPPTTYGGWFNNGTNDNIFCVTAIEYSLPEIIYNSSLTLNSPIANYNTSVPSITFNWTALDYNVGGGIKNVTLIVDGSTEYTNTTGVNGTYTYTKVLSAGLHYWNVTAWNVNGTTNTSETRTINLTILSPTINLYTPDGVTIYNQSNTVDFNATVTDNLYVQNVTLYIDGVVSEFNTSHTNGSYFWTKTIADGTHNWSILAYDNESNPSSSSTISFIVDTITPTITLYYPINATYLNTSLTKVNNFTTWFNWTAFDSHLSVCKWYNGTVNKTITCNANATTSFPFGTYTFIAYANDTGGLNTSSSITATYGYYLFENAVNYTQYTTEANQEQFNFTLNKTSIYSISSVDFYYNGTRYGVTDYSSTSNYQKITKTINVPSVTADGNATFYFSVLFSDGTRVNSSTNTQFVNNTLIGNCSTYTNKIFNFTLVDEETLENLNNGSIEASISLYSKDKSILVHNYSIYINNTDNLQICLSENFTSPNYLIDGIVKYNDLTHSTEYYNFVNYTYTNETIGTKIFLYDLLSVDSTEFQIIFRDENFVALPEVLIYVTREYISGYNFKTVEVPKTDSQGQTIVHLVRNDVNYNLYAIKNGVILATFNNLRAYCEDYTIGNCKLYLTASSTTPQTYNQSEELGISYSFSYSNSTKIITFNFLSSDLITDKNANLVVWRNNYFGNTSYCNTSLLSTSGSLTCNISDITGSDTTVRAEVYINGELIINEYVDIVDKGTDRDYYFIFFIFLISFIFMFIDSKTTVVLGIVLGFGSAFVLGLVKGKMFGVGSAGVFLIIVAILMIWKLNKEKQQ